MSSSADTARARGATLGPWLIPAACFLIGCAGDAGSGAATTGTAGSTGSSEPDAGPACVDPTDGPPTDVFCTGLYENHDATRHAKSAIPYKPGLTFWSDGAEKQRYLYLPPSTQIDTSNLDAWKFPVGTKTWKEFRVDGALVETRFLWKQAADTWAEAAYIWDAENKSAVLTDREDPTLLPSGYEIPSLKSCRKCHGGGADELLGVEAVALALTTAEGVTLTSLAAAGSLSAAPAKTTVALPEDATGKAASALGYLHVNCGMACHSSRGLSGFTQLHTRLRAEELWPAPNDPIATVAATDAYQTGVNQDVILATYAQAFPGTKLIVPGHSDQSLAWLTSHLRGTHQMPPIVSHEIDAAGTQQLAEWIDALP